MEERLTMTTRELDRLQVIHQVLQRKLSWPHAAGQLALSVRQIGRLCARVRTDGNRGLIHRLRGRPSNHHVGVHARPFAKRRQPGDWLDRKLRVKSAVRA